MTNQEYLRGIFFGAGLPVQGPGSRQIAVSAPIEYETGNFSFLLRLGDLQRSRGPVIEETERVNDAVSRIFENLPILDRTVHAQESASEFSLAEFERDMDSIAEGLENLPIGYQGTYPREDIYLDHD